MSKASYSDKLRDPRWQKKRLEVLERCAWTCLNCGDTESELHVHHLLYEKGKEPWEHEYLIAVCEECHQLLERLRTNILAIMADYPPDFLADLHTALCDILEPIENGTHPWERWSRWMKSAREIRKAEA